MQTLLLLCLLLPLLLHALISLVSLSVFHRCFTCFFFFRIHRFSFHRVSFGARLYPVRVVVRQYQRYRKKQTNERANENEIKRINETESSTIELCRSLKDLIVDLTCQIYANEISWHWHSNFFEITEKIFREIKTQTAEMKNNLWQTERAKMQKIFAFRFLIFLSYDFCSKRLTFETIISKQFWLFLWRRFFVRVLLSEIIPWKL